MKIITASLSKLESAQNLANYQDALGDLYQCLQNISEFIQQFTEAKWYKRVVLAHDYQSRVEAFNQQLKESIAILNLGLNAQQIINREDDNRDQKKDQQALKDQYDTILKLMQEEIKNQQHFQGDVLDQQEIVLKQVAALKSMMEAAVLQKPVRRFPVPEHLLVSWVDIFCEEKLGEGAFGKVYKAQWKGQPVAVKVIEGMDERAQEQFIREIQIMSRLQSPSVTQFYGACLEPGQQCLLMEYMAQGSLYDVLAKQVLTPEQQRQIALAVARGLYFLHEQGVIHRDLKSANVLLDGQLRAKLTDFGLAKIQVFSVQTIKERSQALQWMAPETLSREGIHTKYSDIYSYGVILWEIITGRRPYAQQSDAAIGEAITAGRHETISSHMASIYQEILKGCWKRNPLQRISLPTIIQQLEAYDCRPASPDGEALYEQATTCVRSGELRQAYGLYRRSAEKGYFRGQTELAGFLLTGKGETPVDKGQAYQWLLKAAQQHHPRAMFNLANMLEYGDGIKKDLEQALDWYQKAAAQGHEEAPQKVARVTEKLRDRVPPFQTHHRASQPL